MRNAMQLKAIVKNIAREKRVSAQLVLQNYMLERFLERVSLSDYKSRFIIKGGFLIASMVGLESRATMDMDATIKNYPVNKDSILKMMKLDITTGDRITPHEIEYSYRLMLEDRNISVMAYNLSTILAEKLETVISRGDQNTRPRDYYDIYILTKLQSKNIDIGTLKAALFSTAEKRGSLALMKQYSGIIYTIINSKVMNQQWENYRKDFEYASSIEFSETCNSIQQIMDEIYS